MAARLYDHGQSKRRYLTPLQRRMESRTVISAISTTFSMSSSRRKGMSPSFSGRSKCILSSSSRGRRSETMMQTRRMTRMRMSEAATGIS